MRLWIDSEQAAPTGFVQVKTANAAKDADEGFGDIFD